MSYVLCVLQPQKHFVGSEVGDLGVGIMIASNAKPDNCAVRVKCVCGGTGQRSGESIMIMHLVFMSGRT